MILYLREERGCSHVHTQDIWVLSHLTGRSVAGSVATD